MNKFLYDAIDVGVYAPNSSIRLPGCVKIDKHGCIENRKFTFENNECFQNFIIQDISSCIHTIEENIMFDSVPPITIVRDMGNLTSTLIEESMI